MARIFLLKGDIANPGYVDIPDEATTIREAIYGIGGGIPNGKKFKAVQIGGPSGGLLVEEHLDLPLHFQKLKPYGMRRGDSVQVHRMLKSGQIAVGFVGAVSEPENVDYFPLYDDRLVLAAPNNEHYHMLRERGVYGRELLLEEPFVSREEGSGTDASLQNYLRTLGLSHDMLHVVARVDDPEAIKQMVSGGVDVAVLSALAVEQEVQNGTLLAFEMDKSALKRTIYLITLKSQQLSRMEQKLVDFLKSPHRRKRAEAQN